MPPTLPGRTFPRLERVSRLLFHWRAADMSLSPITGQVPTFTRAGVAGWVRDANGLLLPAVHSKPRFEMYDDDADGLFETPALWVEPAITNLVAQPDDLSTWAPVGGTPILTAGQPDVYGGTAGYLIGDDDGAQKENIATPITFTGDGVKAFSCVVAPGPSPATSGSQVAVYDGTAAQYRAIGTVTWVNGEPVLSAVTGTYLGYEKLAYGRRRLLFQTTSVTAANSHFVYVYPAANLSEQGNLYFGGVQVENQSHPSKLQRVTLTSVAETLTYATNLDVGPIGQDQFSVYAKFRRPLFLTTAAAVGTNPELLSLSTAQPRLKLVFDGTAHVLVGQVTDGAGVNLSPNKTLAAADPLDFVLQCKDLQTNPAARVDDGTGFGGFSTGITPFAAFGNSTVQIGGPIHARTGLMVAKITRGLLTLDQMRAQF